MKSILTVFFLMMLTAAFGQEPSERIIRFHADIVIDTTGRIEVTERIKVYAAGNAIKRGIERDVPLYRKDKDGKRVRMETNILSVRCNGDKVGFATRNDGDNTILRIGDANVLLATGEYEYSIVYESFGHIGFFDDYDELYWNVTGNGWSFAIEQAAAAITLPGGASAIAGQTSCYTGAVGSTAKDCSCEDQIFTANRPLAPGEGLTVAVAFPRDVVRRPPPPTKAQAFWYAHGKTVCGLAGLLIFAVYCFFSTRKLGARPRKPVAIPAFKPPRGMSPAEVGYLRTRKYEGKALTATFVDMAVKRALTISCEEKKKYALINNKETARLRPVEQRMHNALFNGGREKVEVVQSNYQRFSQADDSLKNFVSKQWNLKDCFNENKGYAKAGGFVFCAVIALYSLFTFSDGNVIMAFCLASPLIAVAVLKMVAVTDLDFSAGTYLAMIFAPLCLMIGALWLEFDNTFDYQTHWLSAGFYAAMSAGYFAYVKRIRMFTPEGAKIASEIEGFRMYMKTAEEHRLNMLAPPEHTLELFEKLLPYALALDVSNEWCKKFDDVLNAINYHPEWYDSKDDLRKIGFDKAFTGLAASLLSAKKERTSYSSDSGSSSGSGSWSSGSSGGGYVGGGGGGGGGRGW